METAPGSRSGLIENTTFIGVASAIGAALAADIQSPEWRYVVIIAAPLVGKYAQMLVAALLGDTLTGKVAPKRSDVGVVGAIATLALGLGLSVQPASAQDSQPPAFGCGGGQCSIYLVSGGWSPGSKRVVIGGNAVEFLRGAFGVGLGGAHAEGDANFLGGICLIPRVGSTLGPLCPLSSGGGVQ